MEKFHRGFGYSQFRKQLIQLMLTSVQVQNDFLALWKHHFSTGRILEGMSQSSLKYSEDEENAGTIKIRPSTIVTQNDVSEDIPIIAVAWDKKNKTVLGMNHGEMTYDMHTATTTHASMERLPIYLFAISSLEVESSNLADYMHNLLEPMRFLLIGKDGYHDMLFQSPGNPSIIRYVGPGNVTYATPIVVFVDLIKMYQMTEKAETLTQMTAYMNGQQVWNGGPNDA